MRTILLSALFITFSFTLPAQNTARDGDWARKQVVLKNTPEAEVMIRVGDIDNLGFGFAEDFDPFCERGTDAHGYPWDASSDDIAGMDRILLGTSLKQAGEGPCSSDGYSWVLSDQTRPQPISLPLDGLAGVTVQDAYLMLFLDDFQAPVFCSRFQMTLNGKRFAEGEKILNSLTQTGPIGKLVTLPVPATLLDELKQPALRILIDDPTSGAADGFAIDFVKLIVNRKEVYCKSEATGRVLDRETEQPIANATVEIRGYSQAKTAANGEFTLFNLPPGLHPVDAYATGYNSGGGVAEVWKTGNEPLTIYLDRSSKSVSFNGKTLREGESVAIYNIQFDLGSAALRPDGRAELDKIFQFLNANPEAQIELSGHTSSDGDDASNKVLSLRRVQSCKDYLVAKGIDDPRVLTAGFGEERPIAPNDTEPNRAKNRRVEMRVLRL